MFSVFRFLSKFICKNIQSIKSVVRIFLFSGDVKFPVVFQVKDLCILGNGPSLQDSIDIVLSNRRHFDCMAVNEFCSDKRFFAIRPEFYVLVDPLYYIEVDSKIGIKMGRVWEDANRTITTLVECVYWEMFLILPIMAKKNKLLLKKLSSNKNIKIFYINTIVFHGWSWLENFFLNRKRCSFHFQNVLNAALYCGIEMQYKRIILLGADHDWFKYIKLDDNRHIVLNNKHCFNMSGEKLIMVKMDGNFWSMGQLFSAFAAVFYTYEKLAKYARQKHVEVYNGSSNSFIDSFPYIKDII